MTTRRRYLPLLAFVLAGAMLRADDPDAGQRPAPELAQFTCKFDERPARRVRRHRGGDMDNRFEVRGTWDRQRFFIQFSDYSAMATLEQHEALWPETMELHLVGPRYTLTWFDLATDGGVTLHGYIGTAKDVSYFDIHGEQCYGENGRAYRVETVPVHDGRGSA